MFKEFQSSNPQTFFVCRLLAFVVGVVLANMLDVVSLDPREQTFPGQIFTKADGSRLYLKDPAYLHECGETVSTTALIMIAILTPLILAWIIGFLRYRSVDKEIAIGHPMFEDMLSFGLVMSLSINLGGWFTTFMKAYTAEPRPCFYDICQLDDSDFTNLHCDGDLENDGPWASFPSGHATLFAAGLGVFMLYLSGKFPTFKMLIFASFAIIISFLSATRIADYKHRAIDVIAGMFVGACAAMLSYFIFYPSPNAKNNGDPYSWQPQPQIDREDPDENTNIRLA